MCLVEGVSPKWLGIATFLGDTTCLVGRTRGLGITRFYDLGSETVAELIRQNVPDEANQFWLPSLASPEKFSRAYFAHRPRKRENPQPYLFSLVSFLTPRLVNQRRRQQEIERRRETRGGGGGNTPDGGARYLPSSTPYSLVCGRVWNNDEMGRRRRTAPVISCISRPLLSVRPTLSSLLRNDAGRAGQEKIWGLRKILCVASSAPVLPGSALVD